jgi:hypothetical protein
MISVGINPDDERRLLLHLDQVPTRLHTALRPVITSLTDELLRRIHAAEPVRSGRLRRETQSFVDETPSKIVGMVKVVGPGGKASGSHEAAAALEYGAHRRFSVRAHAMHETHVFGRASGRTLVMVEEYTRRANIAARRFIRGPATALRPLALARMRQAIDDAKL